MRLALILYRANSFMFPFILLFMLSFNNGFMGHMMSTKFKALWAETSSLLKHYFQTKLLQRKKAWQFCKASQCHLIGYRFIKEHS